MGIKSQLLNSLNLLLYIIIFIAILINVKADIVQESRVDLMQKLEVSLLPSSNVVSIKHNLLFEIYDNPNQYFEFNFYPPNTNKTFITSPIVVLNGNTCNECISIKEGKTLMVRGTLNRGKNTLEISWEDKDINPEDKWILFGKKIKRNIFPITKYRFWDGLYLPIFNSPSEISNYKAILSLTSDSFYDLNYKSSGISKIDWNALNLDTSKPIEISNFHLDKLKLIKSFEPKEKDFILKLEPEKELFYIEDYKDKQIKNEISNYRILIRIEPKKGYLSAFSIPLILMVLGSLIIITSPKKEGVLKQHLETKYPIVSSIIKEFKLGKIISPFLILGFLTITIFKILVSNFGLNFENNSLFNIIDYTLLIFFISVFFIILFIIIGYIKRR